PAAARQAPARPAAPPVHQAFTVRINQDGSVTFTATDLVDPAAATRELNKAGIAGKVEDSSTGKQCPTMWRDSDLVRGQKAALWHGNTVTIRPTDYPAGGGVLVLVLHTVDQRTRKAVTVVVELAYRELARIPSCLNLG
ncbi:MAG: hypothetical protein J2P15_17805, partial [Micromonosporaceae bacterium]|nr:hypothetical protein [Micromonosporaceae bacterium]